MKYQKFFSMLFIFIFMPSICFADDFNEEESIFDYNVEVSSEIEALPSINSRHAVVLDRSSKLVLYGKKENEICKMASTTKIMTAIVVIENCNNLNDIVAVSKKAARNTRFKTWFICKR